MLLFDFVDDVIIVMVVFEAIFQFHDVEALCLRNRLGMTRVSKVEEAERSVGLILSTVCAIV